MYGRFAGDVGCEFGGCSDMTVSNSSRDENNDPDEKNRQERQTALRLLPRNVFRVADVVEKLVNDGSTTKPLSSAVVNHINRVARNL